MVRTYHKKSTRGNYGTGRLQSALQAVRTGTPLLRASKYFEVPARTLRRHRDAKVAVPGLVRLGHHRAVLTEEVEGELHNHVQHMEKALYGLTTRDIRRLAFDVAEQAGVNHPFNRERKMAGEGWLYGFLSRHPDLSIRQPQGTNLSRAVAFNKPKVQEFFNVYREVLDNQEFTASRVWNMDETGITNVQQPGKILATKGVKQVGKMTSGERGKTVTVICGMNAAGVYCPPMFIFPRKRMSDALMAGAPPQAVGYASPNGWTDSELFLRWLEHFVKFTNVSPDAQHIIILDGHHSHKTLAAVTFARQHGIHLLTLPPHSTHKMQPLDRSYFKSLKSAYNAAADSWMVANPGKRISFFEMAGIFGKAFLRSASPEKAVQGFKTCGIWPFDENIFSDEDFAAAMVTDDPLPAPDDLPTGPGATDAPDVMPARDIPASDSLTAPATDDTAASSGDSAPPGVLAHEATPIPEGAPVLDVILADDSNAAPVSVDDPAGGAPGPTSTDTSARSVELVPANYPATAGTSVEGLSVQALIRSLSPLPKLATPRSRKRKAESATLLTSSPHKRYLEEKEKGKVTKPKAIGTESKAAAGKVNSKAKKSNKGCGKGSGKGKKGKGPAKKKKPSTSSDDEDEAWPCLICAEPFANSRSKETWVQCLSCKQWAHEACTTGESCFVCQNCESDYPSEDSDY